MKALITCIIAIVACAAIYVSCNKTTNLQNEDASTVVMVQKPLYEQVCLEDASDRQVNRIASRFPGVNLNKEVEYDSTQYLNMALLPLHIDTANINKYDADGLKTGIWYRYNYDWIVIEQYDKGILNGYIYVYSYKPVIKKYYLRRLELYNNGKLEAMQLFYENGMIQSYMSKFSELKDFKREIYANNGVLCGSISPDEDGIQFYNINYRENGEKESEGWVISNNQDEVIMDFCMVGKWIYYEPSGEVIKDYGGEI